MSESIPEDIWKAAEDALDNMLCNCIEASGSAAAFRKDSITDIAKPIMDERNRNQWQPIETAPENRAILFHVPSLDYYGNEGVYAGMFVNMDTGKRWMTFGFAIGRDLGPENAPTSWREIPAPPIPHNPTEG